MREKILSRLVALRRGANLSAKEVSARLNKNSSYISRMESSIFFPPMKELEMILEMYDSSLEELFCDEFTQFRFEKGLIEKFRKISRGQKNVVLGMLALAYENRGSFKDHIADDDDDDAG
jgi:transcriptional regulator with XRE-family HTH domain